ncbi:hypothetical protein BDZ89DRAFT_1132849 [Hymenopellis radicata]|nr:hypothetical protein BDZ89DRAFT_1132849 [Hymenopellis radicata]
MASTGGTLLITIAPSPTSRRDQELLMSAICALCSMVSIATMPAVSLDSDLTQQLGPRPRPPLMAVFFLFSCPSSSLIGDVAAICSIRRLHSSFLPSSLIFAVHLTFALMNIVDLISNLVELNVYHYYVHPHRHGFRHAVNWDLGFNIVFIHLESSTVTRTRCCTLDLDLRLPPQPSAST